MTISPSSPKLSLRSPAPPSSAYVPGMYDRLLSPKGPPKLLPTEIRSVVVDVARSGSAIVVGERDGGGRGGRRILDTAEYPYFVDIELAGGIGITVEISRYQLLEVGSEAEEQTDISAASVESADPAAIIPLPQPRYRPANLFGSSTGTVDDPTIDDEEC